MPKAQRFYWLVQIAGWGSLSTLIVVISLSVPPDTPNYSPPGLIVKSAIAFFVTAVLFSHLMRNIIIRQEWLRLRFGPLVPRILILTMIIAFLMELGDVVSTFFIMPSLKGLTVKTFIAETIVRFIFFLLWNGIYLAFHYFHKSRMQEVKNLQLSDSQKEIELKNLRSQLNPHFLFNSLNTIRALVDINPNAAKENITTLSNLLRKSLILGREQLIPLKSELDLVNDYLDLEKVRFEERLKIVIDHDRKLDNMPIPPFIVQTLVENAFKHGISKLVEGGTIFIRTAQEGEKVTIEVENDGKLGKDTETGIGLKNTLRRLELQYGRRADFSLTASETTVIAKIELTEQE